MEQPRALTAGDDTGLRARKVTVGEGDDGSLLVLLLGFATALFAVCATFGGASLHVTTLGWQESRFLVDALLMVFALLWTVALRVLARPLSTTGGLCVLGGIALVGTVLCPMALSADLWVVALPLVAAGCVALVFLWWSHACTIGRLRLSRIVSAATIIAAAMLIAVSFTPPHLIPLDYLRDMAALVSCMLLLGVRNDRRGALLKVSVAESRAHRRDRANSRLGELNYLSVGFVIGADGGLWLLLDEAGSLSSLASPVQVFGLALLIAGITMAAAYAAPGRIDMERLSKDYLSVMLAVGYLFVPLAHGLALVLLYGYLIAVIFIQLLIIFLAGAELVRFEELSPLYSFSEVAYAIGGSVAGAVAMVAVGLVAGTIAVQAGCALVLLYVVIVQVQLNKVGFPEDWMDESEEGPRAGACQGVTIEGVPLPPKDAAGDGGAAGSPEDKLIPAGSYLRHRLDEIGERYGLSPRQMEILDLIARGRDTQYIMDRFTISRATAKTHVYNIYRKLDIHSRQDLYDLIEREDLPL